MLAQAFEETARDDVDWVVEERPRLFGKFGVHLLGLVEAFAVLRERPARDCADFFEGATAQPVDGVDSSEARDFGLRFFQIQKPVFFSPAFGIEIVGKVVCVEFVH